MRIRPVLRAVAGVLFAAALPGAAAAATILQFSDMSSDATPASQLQALVAFEVTGSTLTVTLTNQTQLASSGFNINQLYFSSSADVTNLMLTGASGSQDGSNLSAWTLYASGGAGQPTKSDGFGRFDWALKDGVNGDSATVMPFEIQTYTLTVTCALGALCDASDFGLELSTGVGSGVGAALAAAKFISGPGGDGAFGATITIVPEPATVGLVGLGLLALGLGRRRSH